MSIRDVAVAYGAGQGRDEPFQEAMRRAEEGAVPKAKPSPFVGRTRSGLLKSPSGQLIQPGPLFDRGTFDALPLVD
jgi:hypothetical protein